MKKILFLFLICILYTFPVHARRGCCSWHGGVCGCSNGRQLCCDGSLSPSCVCATPSYESKKIDYTPKIIQTSSGKVEIHPFDKGERMRMFLYDVSGYLSGKATVDTDGNGIMISYDTSQNKTEECEVKKFKPFGFCKKYQSMENPYFRY